jgi:hypothetical protein
LLAAIGDRYQSFAQSPSNAESYELVAAGLRSLARISANELAIQDAAGNVTRYQRSPRYDSEDKQWIAYSSRQAQQVIRWPANHSGRMQIGSLQSDSISFAMSKMQIRAIVTDAPPSDSREVLPPGVGSPLSPQRRPGMADASQSGLLDGMGSMPPITAVHLAAGNTNERQYLSMRGGNQWSFVSRASDMDAAWYITPVANNVVRLQQQRGNDWMAIGLGRTTGSELLQSRTPQRRLGGFGNGAFPRGGSFGGGGGFRNSTDMMALSLYPIHNGADQLWHIVNLPSGGYCFESVLYPGMGLTCMPNQGLFLQPISYDPWQVWWPQTPVFPIPKPQYRSVQQQVVPNPPLPPANVQITNTHTDTIILLLADRRNSQQPQTIRIPAKGAERVQLDRDAGATIIESIETMDTFGNWRQQQFTIPVPPSVLYDISVYEEFLQSIAIDRTGKSPNPVEDVNYQPRSVGFFLIPPGEELPEQADLDAYRIADDAQNPGAVRRFSKRELERNNAPATTDPLKDLLNQFQKQRGAF